MLVDTKVVHLENMTVVWMVYLLVVWKDSDLAVAMAVNSVVYLDVLKVYKMAYDWVVQLVEEMVGWMVY